MEKTIFIVAVVAIGVMGLSMTACDISDVIWGSGGKTIFERVVIQSGEPKKSSSTQNATNPSPSNTNSSSSTSSSNPPVAPAPVATPADLIGLWTMYNKSPAVTINIRADKTLDYFDGSQSKTYSWFNNGTQLLISDYYMSNSAWLNVMRKPDAYAHLATGSSCPSQQKPICLVLDDNTKSVGIGYQANELYK